MASKNQVLVAHIRSIVEQLKPTHGYLIENPRGVLRKLPVVEGLERNTVTYCSYGDTRMKPTDLWGYATGWQPRTACKNGDPCHVAAPRGSRTGTQGIKGAKDRSRVPYELGLEIMKRHHGIVASKLNGIRTVNKFLAIIGPMFQNGGMFPMLTVQNFHPLTSLPLVLHVRTYQ
jgi:hypothetical protein